MGRAPTNTKEKLLDTANELIWQSSYGSVSVDDICNRSGVKKGSFYYYFSSKSELAVTAMEVAYQRYEPELLKVLSMSIPAIERFEKLAYFFYEEQKISLQKYGHVCGCPFASLGSEMAGNEESIREKVDEIFHRHEIFLKNVLEDMVESGDLAVKTDIATVAIDLHVFIMGTMMMARIQNDITVLNENLKNGFLRILGLDKMVEGA